MMKEIDLIYKKIANKEYYPKKIKYEGEIYFTFNNGLFECIKKEVEGKYFPKIIELKNIKYENLGNILTFKEIISYFKEKKALEYNSLIEKIAKKAIMKKYDGGLLDILTIPYIQRELFILTQKYDSIILTIINMWQYNKLEEQNKECIKFIYKNIG